MSVKEFIRFDGVDDRIDFPAYTMPTSGVWFVEFSFVPSELKKRYESLFYLNLSSIRIGSNYNYASGKGYINYSVRSFSPTDENVNITDLNPLITPNELCTVRLEFNLDNGVMRFFVNNISSVSETFGRPEDLRGLQFPAGKTDFGRGFNISDRFFASDLKHININNQHVYDANDSRNTETLLFDSVGGQHATLVNEPTYVDYQDAWYLQFDGVDDRVELPFVFDQSFSLFMEISGEAPVSDRRFLSWGKSNTIEFIGLGNATSLNIKRLRLFLRPGVGGVEGNAEVFDGLAHNIEFRYTNGIFQIYVDDVLDITVDETANHSTYLDFDLMTFGAIGRSTYLENMDFNLFSAEYVVNGNALHRWSPTASNGTGLILEDEIGGNDGTLVNFPTDNSQWVYSPVEVGSFQSSVTLNLSKPSFTGALNFTVPSFTSDISMSLSKPYFNASGQFLPTCTSSIAINLNAPIVSAQASFSSNQSFVSRVSLNLSKPTFRAAQPITINRPLKIIRGEIRPSILISGNIN